jgi:protein-S-isoprenylcysteine O-methyltransferase Ste14
MSELQIAVVLGVVVGLIWAVLSATRTRLPYLEIGAGVGLLAALIWALLSLAYVAVFGLTAADLSHRPEYRIEFPGARLERTDIDPASFAGPTAVSRFYQTETPGTEVVAFYRGELRSHGWLLLKPEPAEGLLMCSRGLDFGVFTRSDGRFFVRFGSIAPTHVPNCATGTPLPPEAVALVAVVAFVIYITRASLLQRRARQLRGGPLRAVGGVARWGPAFAWVPYVVLDVRPGQTMTPDELVVDVGLALIVAGAAFALWAAATLGSQFDLEPEVHSGHAVVRSGPYRFVRHPVYLGLAVHLIGACVASGNLLLTLGVLLAGLPLLYLRAVGEERLLRAELGPAYDAYAHEVGMFVPLLGRRG